MTTSLTTMVTPVSPSHLSSKPPEVTLPTTTMLTPAPTPSPSTQLQRPPCHRSRCSSEDQTHRQQNILFKVFNWGRSIPLHRQQAIHAGAATQLTASTASVAPAVHVASHSGPLDVHVIAVAPRPVNDELEELHGQLSDEKRKSEKVACEKSKLKSELKNLSQPQPGVVRGGP
jgi:hypothetical protein